MDIKIYVKASWPAGLQHKTKIKIRSQIET